MLLAVFPSIRVGIGVQQGLLCLEQLPYPRQSEKIGRLSLDNCGGQSFLFCLLSMYCKTFNVTSTVS